MTTCVLVDDDDDDDDDDVEAGRGWGGGAAPAPYARALKTTQRFWRLLLHSNVSFGSLSKAFKARQKDMGPPPPRAIRVPHGSVWLSMAQYGSV